MSRHDIHYLLQLSSTGVQLLADVDQTGEGRGRGGAAVREEARQL